ncbi:hypothetical protein [Microbacterium paraoxydans]|uniref:hypothetical protein n=1 Tax=Microbacterium paraoxydans TaxID=199592 RepID=UPI0028E9904A|nr:hypothetical protein [Microbacterium paraoxydans]
MVANARLEVDPLPAPLTSRARTRDAARQLEGAHSSVQGLFDTLHAAREAKRLAGQELRRLSHGETDLLRAAVAFAGAGIDAVLKQLLEDTLGVLLDKSAAARGKLAAFAGALPKEEPRLARAILTAPSADAKLREVYLERLTKGSLQSEKELKAVRDALGIAEAGAFTDARLARHAAFFVARNEIVHELDLRKPDGPGDPSRRYRAMSTCRDLANDALQLSADYIRATDALL